MIIKINKIKCAIICQVLKINCTFGWINKLKIIAENCQPAISAKPCSKLLLWEDLQQYQRN